MKTFGYDFLLGNILYSKLFNLSSTIYAMRERSNYRKNKYTKIYTELSKIAKVQSVKNSNAIEGIVTSDERIVSIVSDNAKPQSHSEEEIAGYRDCLNYIHENYEDIDISEKTILSLHEMMM